MSKERVLAVSLEEYNQIKNFGKTWLIRDKDTNVIGEVFVSIRGTKEIVGILTIHGSRSLNPTEFKKSTNKHLDTSSTTEVVYAWVIGRLEEIGSIPYKGHAKGTNFKWINTN